MLKSEAARCLGGEVMKRPAIFVCLLLVCFASRVKTASAQDNQSQSLGDAARQSRAAQSSAPKSATVITDENLPQSKTQAATGKLSPERQTYCDELRQKKDPSAEQACAALALDMGSDYDGLAARYSQLAKAVCLANKGEIPSSAPQDPALASQWRDLTFFAGKFADMMKAEMKTLNDDDAAVQAVSKDELREAAATIPDWPNAKAVSANPKEKQAFHDIQEKYKPRMQENEQISARQKIRVQRYFSDLARMQEICAHH